LGVLDLAEARTLTRETTLVNTSDAAVTLNLTTEASPGLTVTVPQTVTVPAGATASATISFTVDPAGLAVLTTLDARITARGESGVSTRIHAIATVRAGSDVRL